MAKSDKVHKKGGDVDKGGKVDKVDTVTKPKKVKDGKKKKDKEVTSLAKVPAKVPVKVPVSSKEILAKAAVSIFHF